jgi:2-oxoglutarate ferredoxin oxidoreductase subunit alpha
MVNFISHGDTQIIILIPGSVSECFEYGWKAFDIAERFQTPVVVLSDLDFGMNQWMTTKFEYPDQPMDRGKILWEEDLEKLLQRTNGVWGRYKDIDGDGIPYRTIMGNQHVKSGYFTRGTSHDENAAYSEDGVVWEEVFARIARKFETAKAALPKPIISLQTGSTLGIISSGSVDPAIVEARDLLSIEGVRTDYLRVRSLPFSSEIHDFIDAHEKVFVVEINRDGQLYQLLTMEFPDVAYKLKKAARMDGLPLPAKWIKHEILANKEK